MVVGDDLRGDGGPVLGNGDRARGYLRLPGEKVLGLVHTTFAVFGQFCREEGGRGGKSRQGEGQEGVVLLTASILGL